MSEKFEQEATQFGPYPAQLLHQSTTSPQPCLCGTANSSHSISCDGCRHFEYEHDMGTSIPTCKLGKDMHGSCDSFEASDLYLMYAERILDKSGKSLADDGEELQ